MGYVPKFGYTALKNGKEQEAHEGFKNFVFQQGPYMVYFSLHVQSSHLRRVRERFHTITLVVTNKKTGELLIELSHKADFGFLAARRSTFGFMALTEKDEEMREAQFRPRGERRMRTINVVDMGHLDRRFKYRHNPMEGVYEAWTTATICSSVPPHGEITMDIKNPVTGVRNVYDKVLKPVVLGSSTVNVATSRNLRIGGIEISAQHCKFDNYGGLRGGWFYTDAYGKNVLSGPGTNAIRQYIKPGMRISLNGNFELGEDVWAGLFEHNKSGFFMDHGFGVDPMQN